MANEYTVHPLRRIVEALDIKLRPTMTNKVMKEMAYGKAPLWAVYLHHDMATCEWSIDKVEPWNMGNHISSTARGIVQVYARDALEAFTKTSKALEEIDKCQTY
jgi:hypothetical protein